MRPEKVLLDAVQRCRDVLDHDKVAKDRTRCGMKGSDGIGNGRTCLDWMR